MRVPGDIYLRVMRNAVGEHLAETGSGHDAMLASSLEEVISRRTNAALLHDTLHQDVQDLLDWIRESTPQRLAPYAGEIAALSAPAPHEDPALYFRRALDLFERIVNDIAPPGQLTGGQIDFAGRIARWEHKILRGLHRTNSQVAAEKPLDSFSAETVRAFLETVLSDARDLEILRFDEILGGMSKRTFNLTIKTPSRGVEDLIIKKAQGKGLVSLDCMLIPNEFHVLRAVKSAGLQVPEALWLATDFPGAGGDFYIMRKSPGKASAGLLSTDSHIPKSVLLGIAEAMARLHTTPMAMIDEFVQHRSPELKQFTAAQAVAHRLEEWRQAWLGFERLPSPMETYLFSWMKAHIPENSAPASLIHGDLTPHNCLWDGVNLTAVLDWEGAHLGDPAEDLAYTKPSVETRMDWNEFLDHYVAHGGPRFAEQTIEYHILSLNLRSVVLANVLVTLADGSDLRRLLVDTLYSGAFADTCMNAIERYEAMAPKS